MSITVTELRELSPKKFAVGFSDGSVIKLSLDAVSDLSLFQGKELSEEELSELNSRASLSSCKERALRIIAAKPMSCGELYSRLTEKGETPENAEECIEWLLERHYLDDRQYAGMIVRHYAGKGYGIHKIKAELYRRKIPKEIWEDALSEMPENEDAVYELLRHKLKSTSPDRAELKKAADALYRRGFSWDEIRAAIDRFNSENLDY